MKLTVNGKQLEAPDTPDDRKLLWYLRDDLDLTGAKYGCGEGQCGACTVLVDGVAMRSCVTALKSVANKNITTIEGLEKDGQLHPVQQAFIDRDAFQCGYCTSGMIMSAVSMLKKNPKPTVADVKRGMNGNICRCGTYPRIIEAVRLAAGARRAD